MKLFQTLKRDMVILGIDFYQPTNQNLYNKNILLSFLLCGSCIILTSAFIFCEADNFIEYMEPTYILASAIMLTIAAVYICIRIKMLLEYIESFENTVNLSK